MYISDFYGKCRDIYHTWMLWDEKGCCLVEFASIQGPLFHFFAFGLSQVYVYKYVYIYNIYVVHSIHQPCFMLPRKRIDLKKKEIEDGLDRWICINRYMKYSHVFAKTLLTTCTCLIFELKVNSTTVRNPQHKGHVIY